MISMKSIGSGSAVIRLTFKATTSQRVTRPLTIEAVSMMSPILRLHSIVLPCLIILIVAYVIDWSADKIDWIIDGTTVRTLTAASVGAKYPQTPCQVRIGTWCGGCSGSPQGTVQWSGGPTTFPPGSSYVMTIQSLTIENANPADSYTYSDMSGSAASIQKGGAVPIPSGNS